MSIVIINDDFIKTLDFRLLQPRYEKLFKEDNYEKLYVLGTYPDVQRQILKITNPKDKENTWKINILKVFLKEKMVEINLNNSVFTTNDMPITSMKARRT